MNQIFDFLLKSENRDALAWIGAAISAFASAIWIILRFYLDTKSNKKRAEHSSSPSNEQIIIATNKSIAAAGDVHIGVKSLHFVLIILIIIGLFLLGSSTIGHNLIKSIMGDANDIPSGELVFGCGLKDSQYPSEINQNERKNILKFFRFVSEYENQVVYLDLRIGEVCRKCGCARDEIHELPENTSDLYMGSVFLDSRSLHEREGPGSQGWGTRMSTEGIEMEFFIPEDLAVVHVVYIPRHKHLSDRHYHIDPYYNFTAFNGLFIPRILSDTGFAKIELDTVSPTDHELQKLRCIRQDKPLSIFTRLYFGCL